MFYRICFIGCTSVSLSSVLYRIYFIACSVSDPSSSRLNSSPAALNSKEKFKFGGNTQAEIKEVLIRRREIFSAVPPVVANGKYRATHLLNKKLISTNTLPKKGQMATIYSDFQILQRLTVVSCPNRAVSFFLNCPFSAPHISTW